MIRKLKCLTVATALAVGAVLGNGGPPAAAATFTVAGRSRIAMDSPSGGGCIDNYSVFSSVNPPFFAGYDYYPQPLEGNVTGVFAHFARNNTYFYNCGAPYTGNDGTSYWVALVPGVGNPQYGSTQAIVQLGVINCDGLLIACDNTNRIFWSAGGCNFWSPTPYDLGPAPNGDHSYKIHMIGATIYFYQDATLLYTLPASDSKLNCWIGSNLDANWDAERWDRGDSTGEGWTSASVRVTQMQYHNTQAWSQPFGIRGPNCTTSHASSVCSAGENSTDGNWMHLWSDYSLR